LDDTFPQRLKPRSKQAFYRSGEPLHPITPKPGVLGTPALRHPKAKLNARTQLDAFVESHPFGSAQGRLLRNKRARMGHPSSQISAARTRVFQQTGKPRRCCGSYGAAEAAPFQNKLKRPTTLCRSHGYDGQHISQEPGAVLAEEFLDDSGN